MKVFKLAAGQSRPEHGDIVTVTRLPGGRASFSGKVHTDRGGMASLSASHFRSVRQAEAEAIAEAWCHGAEVVYIERSDSRERLPD